MKRMRFSIAGLMGFVLIFALGFAGLKAADETWASICFTLVVVALILAILTAVQSRGKARAYWVGFAVAGSAYAGLVFGGDRAVPSVPAPAPDRVIIRSTGSDSQSGELGYDHRHHLLHHDDRHADAHRRATTCGSCPGGDTARPDRGAASTDAPASDHDTADTDDPVPIRHDPRLFLADRPQPDGVADGLARWDLFGLAVRSAGTSRGRGQPIISLTDRTKCMPLPLDFNSAARASAAALSE